MAELQYHMGRFALRLKQKLGIVPRFEHEIHSCRHGHCALFSLGRGAEALGLKFDLEFNDSGLAFRDQGFRFRVCGSWFTSFGSGYNIIPELLKPSGSRTQALVEYRTLWSRVCALRTKAAYMLKTLNCKP